MPRPSINLEPYKAELINLYQNSASIQSLQTFLLDQHGIQLTTRTIESRLQKWGIKKQNCTASSDTMLHARIRILFFQVGLEEKDLFHVLKAEGFDISPRMLKYIRHQLGLYHRTVNPITTQHQVDRVIEELHTELQTGQIEGYRKELLHRHFRNRGFIIAR